MLNVPVRDGITITQLVIRRMAINQKHIMMRLVPFDILDINLPGAILRINRHGHRVPARK